LIESSRYPVKRDSFQAGELEDPARLEFLLQHGEAGIGLADCWRVVRARIGLIVQLLVGSLILVVGFELLKTPLYTSASTLLIQPDAPRVLDIAQLQNSDSDSQDHDIYATEYVILQSRTLAARVIKQLRLNRTYLADRHKKPQSDFFLTWCRSLVARILHPGAEPVSDDSSTLGVRPGLIDAYLKNLSIMPVPLTRLVRVSYQTRNPELSARIVNAHVRAYIDLELELRRDASRSAREFLEKQLVSIRKRVESSERKLNDYRHAKGIISFTVEANNRIAETQLIDLDRALTDAETERIRLQAELLLVHSGSYGSLPEAINNPTLTALRPQLDQLEAQYASMSAEFNPDWPPLQKLKARLNATRARLAQEQKLVADAVERQYRAAANREEQVRQAVKNEENRALALNDAALQDAVLTRDVETNRELYQSVLKRMGEMEVAEQTPMSNVTVVDWGEPSRLPSSPNIPRAIALTTIFSLMLGTAAAFVLDRLDGRFKSSDELERDLHLPNLASVPELAPASPNSLLATRRPLLDGKSGTELILTKTPELDPSITYLAEESYRSIRTSLLFSQAAEVPRRILITSPLPREGKTHTAVNTASAFAQTGARTLLVDADLRKPSCHLALRQENWAGLSEVLAGNAAPNQVLGLATERLFFISAGLPMPNPSELLTSARMRQMLSTLAGDFDHVFVDSAPVLVASDTIGLATMVDAVVLVVGRETPKDAAREACTRLIKAGALLLGVVLNRTRASEAEYRRLKDYYS
jgi:succinoglycan biosynthesis transport protein ExoP